MEKKKLVGILMILLLACFIFPAFIFAETIIFKDGKKAEGKIIEKTDEYIKVYYDKDVTITWSLDEIESINGAVVTTSSRIKIPEEAIKNNSALEVGRVIEKGASVNMKYDFGYTPLMKAAIFNALDVAKLLIDGGAEINVTEDSGKTALFYAVPYGHLEMTKLLIEKGANVNVKDKSGGTVLMDCATGYALEKVNKEDLLKIAKLLIDKGADVNAVDKVGQTVLMTATIANFSEMVKLLIESGVDVNAKTKDGSTALTAAEAFGYNEIASFLKQHGAQ